MREREDYRLGRGGVEGCWPFVNLTSSDANSDDRPGEIQLTTTPTSVSPCLSWLHDATTAWHMDVSHGKWNERETWSCSLAGKVQSTSFCVDKKTALTIASTIIARECIKPIRIAQLVNQATLTFTANDEDERELDCRWTPHFCECWLSSFSVGSTSSEYFQTSVTLHTTYISFWCPLYEGGFKMNRRIKEVWKGNIHTKSFFKS